MQMILKTVATFVCLIVALLVLIRVFENRFIFYPFKYPEGTWHPEWFDLKLQDCYFETADNIRLHAWLLRQDDAVATLLWCHGNAGNITDRLDNLQRLAKLPVNVFLFDYRGYGKSEGEPTEMGVYRDAQAAYDFLAARNDIDKSKIIIFGRSLGGAVAVDLATRRSCAGLILESTFSSGRDMARRMFPFLPVQLVVRSQFNSIDKIQQLHIPKLFMHGTADSIVPFALGRRLFEAAPEPKTFHALKGAGHNDTYIVANDYWSVLEAFIQSVGK